MASRENMVANANESAYPLASSDDIYVCTVNKNKEIQKSVKKPCGRCIVVSLPITSGTHAEFIFPRELIGGVKMGLARLEGDDCAQLPRRLGVEGL